MLCLVFILVCVMVVISILLTTMMSQVYVGKFKNSKGAIKMFKNRPRCRIKIYTSKLLRLI